MISGEIREAAKRGPSSVAVVGLIGVMVEAMVCLGGRVVVVVAGVDIVFGCVVCLVEMERGKKREIAGWEVGLVWFDSMRLGEGRILRRWRFSAREIDSESDGVWEW
jgi:hypothetical protein